MKKLLVLFICLMLCFSCAAQAENARIIDEADLFTADEEAALYGLIDDFQSETGMDFVIFTSSAYHTLSPATVGISLALFGIAIGVMIVRNGKQRHKPEKLSSIKLR